MFITVVFAIIVITLDQSRRVIWLLDVFSTNNLDEFIDGRSDELGMARNQLNVATSF